MIPLFDSNPAARPAYVTWSIIALCSAIFIFQFFVYPHREQHIILAYGVIPGTIFGDLYLDPDIAVLPPTLTIITSMFLHGGWMHLIGNMLYLWIFGNNVEDAMGHLKFVGFYLLCGIAAFLFHAAGDPQSQIPMVGASGALSGVLGAYLLLFPRAKVTVLVPLFIIFWTFRLPAFLVLGGWFGLQIVNVGLGGDGGIAWWAHIGGFIAGMMLIPFFKNAGYPLFGTARPSPQPADNSAAAPETAVADRMSPAQETARRYPGPWTTPHAPGETKRSSEGPVHHIPQTGRRRPPRWSR